MATISTHNGTAVAIGHNLRDPRITDKETHITKDGDHETLIHIPIRQAYHDLFQASVDEYNAKQTRDERKIMNYYDKVKNDKRRHIAYEMIVGVYGDEVAPDTSKMILKQYLEGFEKRNPQLKVIGAYLHNDEEGRQPHLHIDYIPVGEGFKTGMRVQNSLSKALEMQGIQSDGFNKTAQIKWQRQENARLENICVFFGISIEHPQRGKEATHLETETYKATQRLKDAERASESLTRVLQEKEAIIQSKDQEIDRKAQIIHERDTIIASKEQEISAIRSTIETMRADQEIITEENQRLRRDNGQLEAEIKEAREKRASLRLEMQELLATYKTFHKRKQQIEENIDQINANADRSVAGWINEIYQILNKGWKTIKKSPTLQEIIDLDWERDDD